MARVKLAELARALLEFWAASMSMSISGVGMGMLVGDLAFLAASVVALYLVFCEWPTPVEAHVGRRF